MKKQLINEIRRRADAETDSKQRMKLLVLMKAVKSDLMIQPVGEIVDVSGDVFSYAFGLFGVDAKTVGDPTAYISVSPLLESGKEAFSRYAERANQVFKVDKHEKEACFEFLYSNYGISS